MTDKSHKTHTRVRRDRIQELLKENKGRRLFPTWSRALARETGLDIRKDDFLDPATTSSLKASFFQHLRAKQNGFHSYWLKRERDELEDALGQIAADTGDTRVVLFSEVDEFIGAAMLPAATVLSHAFEVWDVVGEDLSFATLDLNDGLCLEENFYDADDTYVPEGVFELTRWGSFGGGLLKARL